MHLGLSLSDLGLRGENSQSIALRRQQGQLAIGALKQLVVQDDPLIQATRACLGRWGVELVVSLIVAIDEELGTEGEVV
jgi:hypothetical protein